MTEREQTFLLAEQILDRVNTDPDDDLAMLARQLLRQKERLERVLDFELCEWMRKEGYSAGFAEMKKKDILDQI